MSAGLTRLALTLPPGCGRPKNLCSVLFYFGLCFVADRLTTALGHELGLE